MPRPRKNRMVRFLPEINYFKPAGIPLRNLEEVSLTLDELEALRLKDFEGYDQVGASKKMKISRITFQRILKSAHQKIANALVLGRAIKMEGGNIIMPRPRRTWGRNVGRGQGLGGSSVCVCPKCGKEFAHSRGVPCIQQECPDCKVPLRGRFCR